MRLLCIHSVMLGGLAVEVEDLTFFVVEKVLFFEHQVIVKIQSQTH